jgi:redox-sensitive bicupin YhaK (pirin superfamily)
MDTHVTRDTESVVADALVARIGAVPTGTLSRNDRGARAIALRTRGHSHGALTRLVSPGDLGELIKPFVFLDFFEADPAHAPQFGFHPHSGIATLTLILTGQAFYKESTGRQGIIETGGVEWMRASRGVWHSGGMSGEKVIKGFQLWVAMPPELELAETDSQYLSAEDFQRAGPARVIAGEYGGVKSKVRSPAGMSYLDVHLKAGERWTFEPPVGHDVAWIALHEGALRMPALITRGEAVVFREGAQPIEFEAHSDTGFVLGSAIKHRYKLVTGDYSVHTSKEALTQGERTIAKIGWRLQNRGVLGQGRG